MKKKDYRKWIDRLQVIAHVNGIRIGRLVKEKDEWLKWKERAKAEALKLSMEVTAHVDNYNQLLDHFNEQVRLRNITAEQRDQAEKENIGLHNDVQAAEMNYEVQAGLTIKAREERQEILKDFIELENLREADLAKLSALRDEAAEQDKVIAELREELRQRKPENRLRPICKAVVGLNCLNDDQCGPGSCKRTDILEEPIRLFCPGGNGRRCVSEGRCEEASNCARGEEFTPAPAAVLPWCGHGGLRCRGGSCPGPTGCHRDLPF